MKSNISLQVNWLKMLPVSTFWIGDDACFHVVWPTQHLIFDCCYVTSLNRRKWNNKNICSVKLPKPLLLVSYKTSFTVLMVWGFLSSMLCQDRIVPQRGSIISSTDDNVKRENVDGKEDFTSHIFWICYPWCRTKMMNWLLMVLLLSI